ncbi:hypothetical protein D3C72_1700650 [compost metagenome]
MGDVAQAVLDHHHRQPARADEEEERQCREEPGRAIAVAGDLHQRHAGAELQQYSRRGEHPIGDHHQPRGAGQQARIAAARGQQHEEGDAGTGADQHGGAQHMEELQQQVGAHRLTLW